jgi:hypothetical protein
MLIDAGEYAAQTFAGQQYQIVALAVGKPAGPLQDGSWVWGVANRDQRAANDCRATPLEHRSEDLDFARFRNGDDAAFEGLSLQFI